MVDDSPVGKGSVPALAIWRAILPRRLLAAAVPPLVAFAVESVFPTTLAPWSLFYPAVFLSSWLGGFGSGVAATLLSTVIVWVHFLSPRGVLVNGDPRHVLGALIFVMMGLVVSSLQGRLQRSHHDLSESQRLLQAIMDFSPSGIIVKDLEGRYILTNQHIQRLLGVSAAATKGKKDSELFAPALADRHREADAIVLERGAPIVYEETLDVGGEPHVFMCSKFPLRTADGRIFAVCAIWTDITDRKRTEEALREAAADLRDAQRVAHLGSWSWDTRTDRWRWSDEVYRIFGRDPARGVPKLLGENPPLFTEESTAALKTALAKLRTEAKPYEVELELIRPDGTTRWINARGEPVRDASGRVTGLAGAVQDITTEKELQRLRREWTSVVAHDLRQPIGVITMAADLLPTLHVGAVSDRESAMTSRIRAAASGLTRMVNDLLDASLMDAKHLRLERRWVDPRVIVKEAIERLTTMAPGTRVTMPTTRAVAPVFADPMRVGQVLGNLLSNAVKYGEKGSEILLRLEARDGEVEIAVTNRGAGIPREELPHLFGKFTRSRRAHRDVPGLGVGLYIAKGIVDAHGGRMWVESIPGKTTTFHFTLPSRGAEQQVA